MLLQEIWAFIITRLGAPAEIDEALAHRAKGKIDAAESVSY
jgi:hypothetical protein